MSANDQSTGGAPTTGNDIDNASGLPLDPGTTDLGDDVYRDAEDRGSTLGGGTGSGLEGGLDAGLTDLGDDVYRDADNSGSTLSGTGGELEGGFDAGTTDLGDDVSRGI